MKKIHLVVIIITIVFSVLACVFYLNLKWKKESSKLLSDFIQKNEGMLDFYSNRYIDYDLITLERFFDTDGVDSQLFNDTRFNFVDTERKAKVIAKIILPPFYSVVLGKFYFCNIYEYKNIWIVGMFKLPVQEQILKDTYTRLGRYNVYVIISKHTSEVLEIY
jgi:hypothetical protein